MTAPDARTFDFLTGTEGDYMGVVMSQLADVPWAKQLISDIEAAGGLKGENKAKLFELRFGHELHRASIQPQYEVPGEGKSTIDYGFSAGGTEFLVEMMRLEETDAVKAATTAKEFEDGAVMFARHLHSNAEDPRQTPEGETLKAVQRICQKLEDGGKPHKFPPPAGKTHVLLVDFRTFKNGGDIWDRLHIALAGDKVPPFFRHYFQGRLITGVFDPRTAMKGAAEARERLHFVGFVNEKAYEDGSFGPAIQFVANPNLFKTAEEAQAALAGWPLGTPDIINARSKKTPEHLQKIADAMSDMTVGEGAELAQMLKHKWGLRS
ncbi:hypothetical protein J2R96_001429 [Bradyrhizobium elkanii]|nr:hypothetical protein [Bradyrhizobium elkanii]